MNLSKESTINLLQKYSLCQNNTHSKGHSEMNDLFTIGHSIHPLNDFLELLKKHAIDYVIDVRSIPYSEHTSDYNKDKIKSYLNNHDVNYAHMGKYFGARQEDPSLYSFDKKRNKFYLDFKKVQESSNFNIGFENILKGAMQFKIAFMCTEKNPIDCHRAIMVGDAFFKKGYAVKHILEDGNIKEHTELNKDLLNKYFPDRFQGDFFQQPDEKQLIEYAYRQRNIEIGYMLP